MTKWDLSLWCKDGSTYENQSIRYNTLTEWRIKITNHLKRHQWTDIPDRKSIRQQNDTIEQTDLIDIFRTLHPNKNKNKKHQIKQNNNNNQNTHSFQVHTGTFSRTDHILGHKTSLNKFKRPGVISSIFSDHNSMKLEINHRKRNEKKNDYMEMKQHATKKAIGQKQWNWRGN